MPFKTEKKRIGAFTYHVTQLDAKSGSVALLRILKYVGPMIQEAVSNGGGDMGAGTKLTELLTEADFEYFRETMAGQTTVTGGGYDEDAEPALDNIFGEHFASNYLEMFEWLRFALEVNFRSFFAGAVAKFLKAAAAATKESATPSSSPKESTGTSGES